MSAEVSAGRRLTEGEQRQFEEFYAAYPRKEKRRRAESAYKAALGRTKAEDVLAGARRLADDPNLPPREFVPHPASWLNADGWLDEPQPERLDRPTANGHRVGRAAEIHERAEAMRRAEDAAEGDTERGS